MNEECILRLIEIFCKKNGISSIKIPEVYKNDLMKFLADHKKIEDNKKMEIKKFDETKIDNILEGVMGRIV